MISVRNLTKRFGDVVAVDDATFDVQPGEVMGFLGPNGAGKTTTLRILTGYLPATTGTVRVAELDVLRRSLAVRRLIGYLPENVPLYPEMRVEEYLRFRARLKEVPRRAAPEAVGSAMEQCGLTEMRRRLVGHLSKGYRQRVGLADALVNRPQILILDEPTGGLDPNQRKEVLELIRGLAADHTILLSSHVLAEVESISSRVMIIQQGRLVAVGVPGELAGQLQEPPRVVAEVRGEEAALRRALAALGEELAGQPELERLADDWWRVQLTPTAGRDGREALDRALHAEGLAVRELRRQEFSLEELFLRITARAATEAGAAELAEAFASGSEEAAT